MEKSESSPSLRLLLSASSPIRALKAQNAISSLQGPGELVGGEVQVCLQGPGVPHRECLAEVFVSVQNLSLSCIAVLLVGGEEGEVQTGIPYLTTNTSSAKVHRIHENTQCRKFDVNSNEAFDNRILTGLMKKLCK